MMKTVAIALLAAVAFAEPEAKPKAGADPYLLYGGYGLGHLGYGGYYGLAPTKSCKPHCRSSQIFNTSWRSYSLRTEHWEMRKHSSTSLCVSKLRSLRPAGLSLRVPAG